MATANQFTIGQRYNLSTYAPAVLGDNFKNFTVLAILDADTAAALGTDVAALHASVYPSIDDPKPTNNYKSYHYVRGETANGTKVILGLPWIVEASVVEVGAQTRVIRVANTTAADEITLREALSANGYSVLDIATE